MNMPTNYSLKRIVFLGIVVTLITILCSLVMGSSSVGIEDVIRVLMTHEKSQASVILFSIRIPRTLAAFLCGAGLSVSGLLLQSTLNNTLASPSVIGINAGAGLFTLICALLFPFSEALKMGMSFIGAFIAAMSVYLISLKAGVSRTSIVLAGVAISSLMSGFSNAIITLFPEAVVDKVAFNLCGFQSVLSTQVYISFVIVIVLICISLLLSRGIDLLLLGDENAISLGVNVKLLRFTVIVLVSLLAGISVSICGLLSFVGLIVPHTIRRIIGIDTRKNIVASVFFGGSFLVMSDVISRTLFYPYELPVGLLLSLIGAPFFIYILVNKRRRLSL